MLSVVVTLNFQVTMIVIMNLGSELSKISPVFVVVFVFVSLFVFGLSSSYVSSSL